MTEKVKRFVAVTALAASVSVPAASLTGRWVARVPNNDGTFRETVFVLNHRDRRSPEASSILRPSSRSSTER